MQRGTREQLSALYLALVAGGEWGSAGYWLSVAGATSLGPGAYVVHRVVPALRVMLSPGAEDAWLGQKFLQGAEIAKAGKWPKREGGVGLVTADS